MQTSHRAEVVVVGGGVLGCAVAWNLARLGARRVVLFERREIGAASTSRAAAFLTRVRPKPGQTALAWRTRADMKVLEDELGESLGFRGVGALYLSSSGESSGGLDRLRALADEWGEPSEEVERAEAERRVPWLDAGPARRILWMPGEGFVDPYLLASGYARAARARGVELRTGQAVVGLEREGGRVTGVRTERERWSADVVVDAAGPWAGLLAAEAGWHLPMAPVRSTYWITAEGPMFPPGHPCVILPDAHAYTRPEVGGLLFGLRAGRATTWRPSELPEDLSELRSGADPDGLETLVEASPALLEYFPGLAEVGIAHFIAGPSAYTPDGQFVIGALPGVEGLVVCAGFCGAGISVSGGVGRAVAELALTGETEFDLDPFRPDRFGRIDAFSDTWLERCGEARRAKTSG